MAEAFLGEIRVFAGNFAPNGWAFCNGQLMAISQNTALFSILGTQYGGDGRVTFALPNLNGMAAMSQGDGPGLTPRTVGEEVGSPTVTLLEPEIPAHTHIPQAVAAQGTANLPTGSVWAETPPQGRTGNQVPLYANTPNVMMNPMAVSVAGGSQPHDNMQPFLAMSFIICLSGIFPARG